MEGKMINTVELKKADNVVKMVVLADENGKALRMSKSEATLKAATIENASVSRDNFNGTPKYDKRGRYIGSCYNLYMVRIRA
jgi:hypothetical protein